MDRKKGKGKPKTKERKCCQYCGSRRNVENMKELIIKNGRKKYVCSPSCERPVGYNTARTAEAILKHVLKKYD